MHVSVPQCITKSTQMGVKAWLLVHLQSWDSYFGSSNWDTYFGSSLETQWNERPQLPGFRMRMASIQLQWSQPLNVHHIQRVEKKKQVVDLWKALSFSQTKQHSGPKKKHTHQVRWQRFLWHIFLQLLRRWRKTKMCLRQRERDDVHIPEKRAWQKTGRYVLEGGKAQCN